MGSAAGKPFQIKKDLNLDIVIIDAELIEHKRKASRDIPTNLNPNEYRILGVLDRDYSVYTMRLFEISGEIVWRVFRHPSIPDDDDMVELPAVELAYEFSATKTLLGYGYGWGYPSVFGNAHAETYKGNVYIYIKYPLLDDVNHVTVIACPAGIFTFQSPNPYTDDTNIMAVARTADGSLIRAYAKTGGGLA